MYELRTERRRSLNLVSLFSGGLARAAIVAREPIHPLTPNWLLEDVDVYSPGEDEILVEIVIGIAYPKVAGHEGSVASEASVINAKDLLEHDDELLVILF
ncbi:Alcohol dehydrogenase superfamily zinc-type [Penicillium fimorum]|uniref:Alcohol dehydrogenase superfamily zinc-type n=1 Tax=Penicillium fimorum TaxID=1882269 RepID=A0A9W9XPF3_9EURO|nr:Alcohol dehydrogenase superfamily zinc-type [Penicillium fimorum]